MGFAHNLKLLRKSAKLSQQELAKEINVPQTTISDLENGKYDPSLPIAYKVASYFRVSIDSLVIDK